MSGVARDSGRGRGRMVKFFRGTKYNRFLNNMVVGIPKDLGLNSCFPINDPILSSFDAISLDFDLQGLFNAGSKIKGNFTKPIHILEIKSL